MSPAGCFLSNLHGIWALMNMSPAALRQYLCSRLLKPVLCSLMVLLLGAGFVVAAETDDSSLFVEAFTAHQKKDYLLAIEKIGAMNQIFPDTPLRDVALLLLARSALKSGDNELAAKTITQFTNEFAANPLKATIEDDLFRLGNRWRKGERLSPSIALRTAALKVRNEQLALERPAATELRQAGMTPEAPEARRRELERLATLKAAQENVRLSISVPGHVHTVAVGQRGEVPFEIVNPGVSDGDFVLEAIAPPEYDAMLTLAGRSGENPSRVTIGTATPFKGSIVFRMPADKVDGSRSTVSLRAVSEKHRHVVQTRETQIITSAPLVRAVARAEKQRLAPGEQTRYRVTVLNVGTLPALGLTVRVILPARIELLEPADSAYHRDAAGSIIFRVDALNTGKLAEFTMDVKVRRDSPIGQELRSRVEVVNNQLQTQEIFTSAAVVVAAE